jgi:hypothetical protein
MAEPVERFDDELGEWVPFDHEALRAETERRIAEKRASAVGPMFNLEQLKRANNGSGATMGMTDREYAQSMFDIARAEGRPDPEPLNKKSAAIAPKRGVFRKATGV